MEVLCGILSGSAFGPHVRRWGSFEQTADLAHCFIALDPACFAPGFEGRLSELLDGLRAMAPVDENNPVMVPGDPERRHMAAVDAQGGVRYHPNQLLLAVRLTQD